MAVVLVYNYHILMVVNFFFLQREEFDLKAVEQLDEIDKLLGSNVVSNYLRREWVQCAEMWSNFGRRMFHQHSNTNNLVER